MANALTFKIGAETTGLRTALGRAQAAVNSLKPAMVGVAAAGAAAFAALGVAAAGVKAALDMGGQLSDIAGQTGLTAGKVMLLRTAFDQAGIGADQVGTTINRMQRSLAEATSGTGPAAEALNRLGLSASELSAQSPDQAFNAIGAALAGITNPTERAATAMDIFGKSGGKLLTLFGDSGALATAGDTLGAQASIMDKNAAVFDRTSDLLNATSNKLQGVFVGMAESIAPAILPLLEQLNRMDLTALGQQLGSAASIFIQAITDGSIWSILGDSAQIALLRAVEFVGKALTAAGVAIGEILLGSIRQALLLFGAVTKPGFWTGMLQALIGAATTFGTYLMRFVADVLATMQNIPGLEDLLAGPLNDAIAISDELASTARNANRNAANSDFGTFLTDASNNIGQTFANAGNRFSEAFAALPGIDTTEIENRLNDNLGRLGNTVDTLKTQAVAALPAPNTGVSTALGTLEERNAAGAAAARATNQPLFASSLAKIGGGGGIAGGPSALLDENRRQTQFLRQIAQRLGNINPTPLLA